MSPWPNSMATKTTLAMQTTTTRTAITHHCNRIRAGSVSVPSYITAINYAAREREKKAPDRQIVEAAQQLDKNWVTPEDGILQQWMGIRFCMPDKTKGVRCAHTNVALDKAQKGRRKGWMLLAGAPRNLHGWSLLSPYGIKGSTVGVVLQKSLVILRSWSTNVMFCSVTQQI